MSEGNAYTKLLTMIKQQGYNKDIRIAIGKVVSPTPLVINIGKYNIEEDDMTITESVKNLITGKIGDSVIYTEPHKLKAGDRVLVLIDDSDFYVMDRVV